MEELNGDLFSNELIGSIGNGDSGSLESNNNGKEQDCLICNNKLSSPRVLSCLHVFCESCIDKQMINGAGDTLIFDLCIECPLCKQETKMPSRGASDLPADYVITNILDVSSIDHTVVCTCCKSKDVAVARCNDCSHFLCQKCTGAHEFMRCFEKHRVVPLDDLRSSKEHSAIHKPIICSRHAGEAIKYYCKECECGACTECLAVEHKVGLHRCERISDAEPTLRNELMALAVEMGNRARTASGATSRLDDVLADLQRQKDDAQIAVQETYALFAAALERKRENALQELELLHKERELKVMDQLERVERTVQRMEGACAFANRLVKRADGAELVSLWGLVRNQLIRLRDTLPDLRADYCLAFSPHHEKLESAVEIAFGEFRTEMSTRNSHDMKNAIQCGSDSSGVVSPAASLVAQPFDDYTSLVRASSGSIVSGNSATTVVGSTVPSMIEYNLQQLATIAEKESTQQPFTLAELLAPDLASPTAFCNLQALAKLGLGSETNSANGIRVMDEGPLVRTTKAAPMHIRFKFGQLGSGKGQFNSPHGFCLGNDEDIIVADTNNHRVTVFDKTGTYKFHFGVAGKEEGQLWYPRKVAVIRSTGKFIVCDRGNERSRMQIFTKNGHFLKKIAVRFIDIVAGLAVTSQGRIVTVDSVTPTVFIISENGDLLSWFDCSECMREPSDIAISGNEFYVCDFKGHCVVVFSEEGRFLRRIGCETITNFPNGIDVSDAGDVLIGDSHGNKFHVVVFSREGILLTEFECPYVKVSRCCGLKITSEGHIVTLAKNNHHVLVLDTLYIE